MAYTLFSTQTTNGTSDAIELTEGKGAIAVSGTFDSCSIAIEMSIDGGSTYITTDTITSSAVRVFNFIKRGKVRAVLSSAGGSTSITVKLQPEV